MLQTLAPHAPAGAERAGGGSHFYQDRLGEWRLGRAYGLAFSPDGKQLATAHRWWVVVWDPATGRELRRFRAEDGDSVSFLPDSRTLFLAGRNTFRSFDTATGSPIHLYEGHQNGVTAIAYAPDGKQIATAATGLNHGELLVWDVESRHVVLQSDGWTVRDPNLVYAPRGNALAATHGETVLVWDTKTGEQRFMIPGQNQMSGPHSTLAISNDAARLAFGSSPGWATLYDFATGKELEFLGPGDGSYYTRAFSPDLRLAAGVPTLRAAAMRSTPSSIHLRDFQTGKELKSLPGNTSRADELAFSPNGRTMMDAWGQIILREIASGKPQLVIPSSKTSAVAFSPDGRRLALAEEQAPLGRRTAREDDPKAIYPILIVDLATGRSSAPLTGHRGTINGLAFSPDGKFLASASDDTTALLWDVEGLLPAKSVTFLSAEERNAAWADLAGDAKPAYRSMWKLADDPGSIDLFRRELKSAAGLADQASQLRGVRAIEALEKMNTPAARELLAQLAGGRADSPFTMEAKRPLDGIIEFAKQIPPQTAKAESQQPRVNIPRPAQNATVVDSEKDAAKAVEKLGGSIETNSDGHIISVTLIGTNTTDADLKQLKLLDKLERLFVGATKITDAGLEELKHFKNLQTLGLRQTKVTAEGAKKLQEALPECRILRSGN